MFRLVFRAHYKWHYNYKSTIDILKVDTSFQNLDISTNSFQNAHVLCIRNIITLFSAIENET